MDVANSPSFSYLNMSKSAVNDVLKGYDRWLKEHGDSTNKFKGKVKKVHQGATFKYKKMESVLIKEYERKANRICSTFAL